VQVDIDNFPQGPVEVSVASSLDYENSYVVPVGAGIFWSADPFYASPAISVGPATRPFSDSLMGSATNNDFEPSVHLVLCTVRMTEYRRNPIIQGRRMSLYSRSKPRLMEVVLVDHRPPVELLQTEREIKRLADRRLADRVPPDEQAVRVQQDAARP